MLDIEERLGFACGEAGIPTKRGEEYLLLDSQSITVNQKMDYVTSMYPLYQLYGFLLMKNEDKEPFKDALNLVEKSKFKINYCFGCGGYEPKTIEEVIIEIEKLNLLKEK